MTNFDFWRGRLTPYELADMFANCDSDACVFCPASCACDLDAADELGDDPTIGDKCRATFIAWARGDDAPRDSNPSTILPASAK